MELILSFSLYVVSGERTQAASLVQCVVALRGEVSPVGSEEKRYPGHSDHFRTSLSCSSKPPVGMTIAIAENLEANDRVLTFL